MSGKGGRRRSLRKTWDVLRRSRGNSSSLQKLAEYYREKTNAKFIVILNQQGIRFSHPNPDLIGKHFTGGDEGAALAGKSYISKAVGISGPSIRAFVPVLDPATDRQLGVVVVGMFEQNIFRIVYRYFRPLLVSLIVALAAGIIGSLLLAKSIKQILHDLEPDEIAKLFREHQAMLECLREGVIAIDRESRITLVNGAARKILSLYPDTIGKKITDVIPNSALSRVIATEHPEENVELIVNGVSILVNRMPIHVNGRVVGAIATFRDITEVRRLAEELTGVQQYVEGLRAKTHEFMNKLQTLGGLLELGEYAEAKKYISNTTSSQQKLWTFLNRHIRDPKVSGLLLGKIQQAEELNLQIRIDPGSHLNGLPQHVSSDSVVLILGNLLQNAMEALLTDDENGEKREEGEKRKEGEIHVLLIDKEEEILLAVEDNGPGIPEETLPLIFTRGYSTRGEGRGYGLSLVKNQVENVLGGKLHVHSAVGEGTSFVIQIPKAKRHADSGEEKGEQNREQIRKRPPEKHMEKQ
ncbi:sensor histidine kinase [Bacillaceae bacterium]